MHRPSVQVYTYLAVFPPKPNSPALHSLSTQATSSLPTSPLPHIYTNSSYIEHQHIHTLFNMQSGDVPVTAAASSSGNIVPPTTASASGTAPPPTASTAPQGENSNRGDRRVVAALGRLNLLLRDLSRQAEADDTPVRRKAELQAWIESHESEIDDRISVSKRVPKI